MTIMVFFLQNSFLTSAGFLRKFPAVLAVALRSLLLLIIFFDHSNAAAAPSTYDFVYNGRLTEVNGRPVTGPVALRLRFFTVATGGTSLLDITSGLEAVSLSDGMFTVNVPLSGTEMQSVFSGVGQQVYVEFTDLTNAPNSPYPRLRTGLIPFAAKVPVDNKSISFSSAGELTVGPATGPLANQFLTKDGGGNFIYATPDSGNMTNYDNTQEASLTTGWGAAQKGKTWFNSQTNQMKVWDGTAALALGAGGGGGSVTSITAGTGLSGGTITTSGTIAIANTTVTPGSYTRANVTVDQQGRLTAAANGSSVNLTSEVTGTLPVASGGTGATTHTNNGILVGAGALPVSTLTGTTNQVLSLGGGNAPVFSLLSDAHLAANAAIARAKIASGTANHVLINDGSGVMSSEAALSVSRGGTGQTTANASLNALLPTQATHSGKFLTTNGTDSSWSTVAATPGGATTQIQFNNSGAFAGSSSLTWDPVKGMLNATAPGSNMFFGDGSGTSRTTGVENLFMGSNAGTFTTTGSKNVFVGFAAGDGNVSGEKNTVIGSYAGLQLTSSDNTLFGHNSGRNLTSGAQNTFIGKEAGLTVATGSNNVVVGNGADSVASGSRSVAIGDSAFANSSDSIAIGMGARTSAAGQMVVGSGTSPITNVFIGTGPFSAGPVTTTLSASGGLGTNIAGATMGIAGGVGTGTGLGGAVVLSTSSAGSSGATENPLTPRLRVSSAGNVGIGAAASADAPYLLTVTKNDGASTGEHILGSAGRSGGGNYSGFVFGYLADGAIDNGSFIRGNNGQPLNLGSEATATLMTLKGANVGVNNTNPGQTLSVGGTVGILETGASPTFYSIFQGGDQASNITYTLPVAAPASSGQVLSATTGGVMSWISPGGGGTVTSVVTGTGLTGGPITGSGTIDLANTAVTPGAYTRANVTVDQQGRITAAASGSTVNLTSEVTGTLPVANGGTGAISHTNNGILVGAGVSPVSTLTGTSNQVLSLNGSNAPVFSLLSDAHLAAGAAIARAKIASGTANHVLINDGSGVMSSEAALAVTRGGTGQTTANASLNVLLPTQASQSGKFLTTNGTDTSWSTVAATPGGATTQIQFNDAGVLAGNAGLTWNSTKQALGVASLGSGNMFIGTNSGLVNTTGIKNTFLGDATGTFSTTGIRNTFTGSAAGVFNSTGSSNTFIGASAGFSNTIGSANTYIGYDSGSGSATASSNTFVGEGTGNSNDSGSNNTFLGRSAGSFNFSGANNTVVGFEAGFSNTTNNSTTMIGYRAGRANTAAENTFVGVDSGRLTTSGGLNTFIGSFSGQNNTTGSQNTFIGRSAGNANTTGANNTFVGTSSGLASTSGSNNVFIGSTSGNMNSSGSNNIFIGLSAGLFNTTGANNTFMGTLAGSSNSTGANNTFIGSSSGNSNTVGSQNTYLGLDAGRMNTAGGSNTMIGYYAGRLNTAGSSTFVGWSAGAANTTGTSNSFFGAQAGIANTTGISNTFLGNSAGVLNTTGANNTFVGTNSGIVNSTGFDNTSLGFNSGASITTGARNVAIGRNSDNGASTSNAIALGATAVASGNNSVAIGAGVTSSVANEVLIGTTSNGNKVGIGITPTLDAGYNLEVGGSARFVGGICASAIAKGSPACTGITSGQLYGDSINTIGAYDQVGMAAPAVSAAGSGRLYFDSTSNKFRVSQNAGAYIDLLGGSGTVTSITAGTGLSGGAITTSGTIDLANTTVTPAAYTRANFTVDAQGRLTSASNGAAIALATEVSGTLAVGSGGTGATSFTNNGVLLGSGATPLSATVAGTADQVLRVPGAGGSPAFGSIDLSKSAAATGILPAANYATMVGDSGAGGTKGAVPAPGTGDAAAGKFLKADGTWAAAGGAPAGATTQIQYNNAGAAGASSDLTFNNTTKRLAVNGQLIGKLTTSGSATIDWDTGNFQKSTVAPGTITFSAGKMQDGTTYTLILTQAGTYTFANTDISNWKCVPACGSAQITTTGETLINFVKAGTDAYVAWVTGF